uniref:Fibronectin type-III domain-containing protein n=1 Tax=Ciona savignyi TaxID=51511 RepID=H2ZP81_CIOSA
IAEPGTPTALVLKPVSTTELLTEWEIPLNPNGIIRRYIIRFKQNYPHPSTNYTLIETNQTRYLLGNLEPGAEYVALFAAVNSAGVGNFTESYFFKMPESKPGPVSDLHVSSVNAISATVAWQPPEQPNGEIIRYVLNISTDHLPVLSVDLLKRSNSDKNLCLFDHKSKSDKTALVSVTSSLQNNSVTEALNDEIYFDPLCPVFVNVTSLLPFTLYRFRVTAWTSSGEGDSRIREEMTLEDVPDDPPRHVRLTSATHTSLNVTWFPPNQPNGIVTYTIAVLQSDKMFQSNLTYYDINELRPFTKYGVMVRAETSVGVSPWSEILFADTQQGRPGSVQNLTAQVETSRSVTLQWNPPINPNGVITGYWIFAKVKNVTQLTLWLEGVSRVCNTNLLSPRIRRAVLETLQDVPSSPPINLSYYNVSSTAVNITWDEPLEANGVIIKYVVYYMTKDTFLDVTVTERFALIKDLKIFSPYEVRVRPYTLLGDGPASGTLLIHTDEDFPASPVRNVTSKNITSSVVELSWTPPLIINGRARSYTVYTVVLLNSYNAFNSYSNKTSAFLTNLRVFTAYKVQVACQTKKGLGNILSKTIFIQTEEGQPATPPFNVSYQNLTSTKVRLTWRRPLVPNGIIQFYEISLTSKNNKTIRATTENDVTAVTVDHLTAYSEYTATVRANTKFGDGSQQSHALTIHTLEDVPGSPVTNVTYVNLTSSSIGLEWSLPKEPNGKILKYSIRYSMLEGNMNQYKAVNDTFVELFDLNKYTRYNVSVSAHTVAGEGPPAYISLHTDEDEPESAPYDIIFQQYNSTTIALTWRPPVKPNGIIVNYTVYYSNEDKVMTKTTTKPRTVLRNLEKFTEYEVYLTASTKLGNGGKISAIETFQTLEDAPADPPRDVVVKALSSTSISVGWSTPATPNGQIQFYTVFYTDKISAVHATNVTTVISMNRSTSSSKILLQITNGTNAVIKDLNKYSDYLVWVSGSTALGDGNQLSDAKKVRTMED